MPSVRPRRRWRPPRSPSTRRSRARCPSTGLTLSLPSTPGTVGPFTATGGAITMTIDRGVSLGLTVSGSTLNLTCTPYTNDSAPTGISSTAPGGSPISPVIATGSTQSSTCTPPASCETTVTAVGSSPTTMASTPTTTLTGPTSPTTTGSTSPPTTATQPSTSSTPTTAFPTSTEAPATRVFALGGVGPAQQDGPAQQGGPAQRP